MDNKIAEDINILGCYLGERSVPELSPYKLREKYNINSVDVMVLFGGSIIIGGDVLAQAMRNNIAEKYIIVGGIGHTTETLRQEIYKRIPGVHSGKETEAELFSKYLDYKYNLKPDLLECRSTNCGNNITYMLDMLKENHIDFNSIILLQDATMQRRMDAVLRKYVSDKTIINFATYRAKVVIQKNDVAFEEELLGMWNIERYITLLMGEIPRLSDNKDGYGPQGKNYIAHIDIPETVINAFNELTEYYGALIREANSMYASSDQPTIIST